LFAGAKHGKLPIDMGKRYAPDEPLLGRSE